MRGLPYSEEETRDIAQYLERMDRFRDAMSLGQALLNIYQHYHRIHFEELERVYRTINSRTHLVAMPFEGLYASLYSSMLPEDPQNYPFYLWIGTNGTLEAKQQYALARVTPEQNMINLINTGMLVPKPPTVNAA
jgi:hypothetical protein